MQQLKGIEEEWCIEGICRIDHKSQKNIKHKAGGVRRH